MTVAGVPLVFVWLGPRAPDHLEAALELALRCSGLDVVLVAPAEFSARVPAGCAFVALESFYDPARSIELRIGSDHRFRQGFWLRTSERFLVLDRYMEWAGLDVMMHAELDCLMFGVDELVAGLESSGRRGLFVPFDRPDRCIASLLHCNDRDALRNLAAFMTSGVEFANDMEMLAAFAGVEPASVTALPTIETILDPSLPAALPCPSVSPGEIF